MPEPLLLSVARLCEGLAEIPGPQSNPVIVRWAKDIGAPAYTDDSVAWCAVAQNRWVMTCGWPMSAARGSYDLLRAKSFETWGQKLEAPALGCVMVFKRPEGAHVGIYVGERIDAYRVLGGNTSNAVAEAWLAKDRLTAIRWPHGLALPLLRHVFLADNGQPVSTNEA